jgi:hypothetical protein
MASAVAPSVASYIIARNNEQRVSLPLFGFTWEELEPVVRRVVNELNLSGTKHYSTAVEADKVVVYIQPKVREVTLYM